MDVVGKRILILGLAREGASLARFLAERGAVVTVTDSASEADLAMRTRSLNGFGIRFALGGDQAHLVTEAELFFVSPGVPKSNPVYSAAIARGLRVESMTTLFFDLCPAKIIGVTGSSGKTTTASLIAHILRHAGLDTLVAGNIGDPMLDLLPSIRSTTTVVLELSSFQLELLTTSPHMSVVTNITPNHLDRHATMEAYVAAKLHITQHQKPGDWAILNAEDSYGFEFARSTPARVRWFAVDGHDGATATLRDGWLGIVREEEFIPVIRSADMPLPGRHNIENALAALCCAQTLGVAAQCISDAVPTFQPAPHRLQMVVERRGVRYIDDSIATTPARSIVAMEALTAPVLLIAGGRDKRLPWSEFAHTAKHRARAVYLIGEAATVIESALLEALAQETSLLQKSNVQRCATLEDAVERASGAARPGDVVLLSPGCASYDMFRDFEQRAAVFACAVEALDAA